MLAAISVLLVSDLKQRVKKDSDIVRVAILNYASRPVLDRGQEGILEGLKPKKRGRKANPKNPLEDELKMTRRDVVRLQRKLEQAETIIDIQKKVSSLLGIPLETPESEESD